MSKGVLTEASAPIVEEERLVGHHHPPPPPSYDQTMGQGVLVPPPSQPAVAPYPQQNLNMGAGMVCPPVQQQHMLPPPHPAPVIIQATTPGIMPVGPKPSNMRCPACHSNIRTTTESQSQSCAHIACIIMFLLGCCLCSCIPYCMDSCKNVRHTCPNCKTFLGMYKP
ncbi:lipopolysaccharide-induced tumor necrosis factor-alpha factor homolog isoform X2 [Cryptotermes secundus]|uniref:lipopolysaccharide-induced tumor necrosis factor-alpha factor homolog isoform X2 n=1 Tax=Cryptotermes secundus TaxID=105785 RepID=UPI001454BAE7|nr:lipopolysaccharide-induced tumor necrosis factor-alpha factor homolog isoform X2 [Cryptotermes secundus]